MQMQESKRGRYALRGGAQSRKVRVMERHMETSCHRGPVHIYFCSRRKDNKRTVARFWLCRQAGRDDES